MWQYPQKVSLLFLLWVRYRRQKSFNNLNCLVTMLYIKNIVFFGTIQNQMCPFAIILIFLCSNMPVGSL